MGEKLESNGDSRQIVACELCGKSLHRTEFGVNKFPIWVHHGSDLLCCHALRFDFNFLEKTIDRLNRHGIKFGELKRDFSGKPKFHNEK